jgi:DNA-binding IscR family transcriptional regulator
MKLSKKGEYALRALIDLGIAAEVGRDLLRVGEIAEKEKIPAKFLEQVMQDLRGLSLGA